jgi:PadR family transcriptional regulator, regulatory protein PadR
VTPRGPLVPLQDYVYLAIFAPTTHGGERVARDTGALLQGTLGLLILKALVVQELHGYGIARWVQEISGEILQIEEGSLYPALRRLEDRGLITSRWAISENNRRARYYALTTAGRRHLREDASTWLQFSRAVTLVLRAEPSVL